jgi:sn-glycerol 3-phosphate transport system substrate-binding protein
MRHGKRIAVVVTTALVVATVGVAGSAGARVATQGGGKCPLNALKNADKPVEITFWHGTDGANQDELVRLTDEFNSSQSDVRVELVHYIYEDAINKYIAGLETGDLPDLVMIEDTGLQQMIDTQSVLPAQACVKADKYDLSDHLERVVNYYTVDGTLWPMPFNVSNPILYFNKIAFRAAGLDPADPPSTLDEIKTASQQLKDAGVAKQAGFALKMDPWYLEQLLAKEGKPYVNNGNGRKERATAVAFDGPAGQKIFKWFADMVDSGLAITNEAEGASVFDNLLAIGADNATMTIDTSAGLGTVKQLLESGQFPNAELGIAPIPGPEGKGGVLVGGAALYISNQSPKAKQAAAWEYLKFLNEPESQAEWAAATGYVPIRESAAELPVLQQRWAEAPEFKVAYDQLVTGKNNTATAGPVIGDYEGVRDSVVEALQAMFTQGKKPRAALKGAAEAANARIEEYNSRVGA